MPTLLDDPRYIDFLARTHPELEVDTIELDGFAGPAPVFAGPLDTSEPLLDGVIKQLLTSMSLVLRSTVVPPTLFLGTPFERYDQTSFLERVTDPAALAKSSAKRARGRNLQLVVLTNVQPDEKALQPFVHAGFLPLPSFPDTVVDLASTWDGHLATLPAGDRSGIRRNLKKFARAGHRLERVHASDALRDDLYAAYRPMFERARVRWFPHQPDYFGGLAGLDERVHLTVAKTDQGKVAGFVVNFDDRRPDSPEPDWFHAGRVGVSPEFHQKDAVYFALMYHLLQEAIAAGAAHLSLEPTGYRMKRHMGARAVPLCNLVLGVGQAWRALLSTTAPIGRHLLAHLSDVSRLEADY